MQMDDKDYQQINKSKKALWIIGGVAGLIALFVLGYAIKAVLVPVKVVTKQIDTAYDVVDKTITADNAIANYEWFKVQHEKIQATDRKIQLASAQVKEFKELYGIPTGWNFQVTEEYGRISAVRLGLRNQYENLVAEYNARSGMANRVIFKDKLPFNIDKKIW